MASWTASEPGATRWDSSMRGWGSGAVAMVEVGVDILVVVVVEDKSLQTLDQAPLSFVYRRPGDLPNGRK